MRNPTAEIYFSFTNCISYLQGYVSAGHAHRFSYTNYMSYILRDHQWSHSLNSLIIMNKKGVLALCQLPIKANTVVWAWEIVDNFLPENNFQLFDKFKETISPINKWCWCAVLIDSNDRTVLPQVLQICTPRTFLYTDQNLFKIL